MEARLVHVFVDASETAIGCSPAGGVVTSVVVRQTSTIVTTIGDQGRGIPAANLPRVFDRFFTHRPEASRPHASHTGLGLAIVKAIVDGYGGSITPSTNAARAPPFEIPLPAR